MLTGNHEIITAYRIFPLYVFLRYRKHILYPLT